MGNPNIAIEFDYSICQNNFDYQNDQVHKDYTKIFLLQAAQIQLSMLSKLSLHTKAENIQPGKAENCSIHYSADIDPVKSANKIFATIANNFQADIRDNYFRLYSIDIYQAHNSGTERCRFFVRRFRCRRASILSARIEKKMSLQDNRDISIRQKMADIDQVSKGNKEK